MKARPECLVCLLNQALNTSKVVCDDPSTQHKILAELGASLDTITLNQTPSALSKAAYTTVSRVTGVKDPYRQIKKQTNAEAKSVVEEIKGAVLGSEDPLKSAVHAAAAGNIIDLGIGQEFDIKKDILTMLKMDFAVEDYDKFLRDISRAETLVYLGDNAGEIVFDMLLVEQLQQAGLKIVYTVKSGPIINDALMEDARYAGINDVAEVIETGSDDIGVNWQRASDEFREKISHADIIISKGQGNFETCNDQPGNYYFLLKAKCEMVAEELGVNLGEIVFKNVV